MASAAHAHRHASLSSSAPPNAPTVSGKRATWRLTKVMNMRDLSRDDDFLSHLLVEKLGTPDIPLLVHKMDANRRLPRVLHDDLITIVRRLVLVKGNSQNSIRSAVDDLLVLPAVRYFIQQYNQKQINAFATHASRYFELYLPTGSIEIAHTQRYSHRTGKSELCILATRPLAPGTVLSELKGSMADLTDAEDQELKRTDTNARHTYGGIRRDFSVIHSRQMKKNHLFLGPARFVNHDCDNNCELFREGRYITFRVIKPIGVGEEVTAHYGDGYFGRNNRHCLCETTGTHPHAHSIRAYYHHSRAEGARGVLGWPGATRHAPAF
ncbi:SET domain-containing protein [Dentipellis sp. KUC8613]|nr:SET domain-containing protein [Dentipellis sp. KUC8613]